MKLKRYSIVLLEEEDLGGEVEGGEKLPGAVLTLSYGAGNAQGKCRRHVDVVRRTEQPANRRSGLRSEQVGKCWAYSVK